MSFFVSLCDPPGHLRRGISSRRCKADARESREGRWYGMTESWEICRWVEFSPVQETLSGLKAKLENQCKTIASSSVHSIIDSISMVQNEFINHWILVTTSSFNVQNKCHTEPFQIAWNRAGFQGWSRCFAQDLCGRVVGRDGLEPFGGLATQPCGFLLSWYLQFGGIYIYIYFLMFAFVNTCRGQEKKWSTTKGHKIWDCRTRPVTLALFVVVGCDCCCWLWVLWVFAFVDFQEQATSEYGTSVVSGSWCWTLQFHHLKGRLKDELWSLVINKRFGKGISRDETFSLYVRPHGAVNFQRISSRPGLMYPAGLCVFTTTDQHHCLIKNINRLVEIHFLESSWQFRAAWGSMVPDHMFTGRLCATRGPRLLAKSIASRLSRHVQNSKDADLFRQRVCSNSTCEFRTQVFKPSCLTKSTACHRLEMIQLHGKCQENSQQHWQLPSFTTNNLLGFTSPAFWTVFQTRFTPPRAQPMASQEHLEMIQENIRVLKDREATDEEKEDATNVLGNLASRPANRSTVAALGALPPLVALLRDGSDMAKYQAAYTLSLLAEEVAASIAACGGREVLEALAQDERDDWEVKMGRQCAERTLWMLPEAPKASGGPGLSTSHKPQPMASQNRWKDRKATEVKDAEYRSAAVAQGALPPLVQLLRHLAESEEVAAALEASVKTLKSETSTSDEQRKAAEQLGNWANESDEKRGEINKAGGCEALVGLLFTGSDDAKYLAARALANLAQNEEAKAAILQADGIAMLSVLVKRGKGEAQAAASRTLELLSQQSPEHPAGYPASGSTVIPTGEGTRVAMFSARFDGGPIEKTLGLDLFVQSMNHFPSSLVSTNYEFCVVFTCVLTEPLGVVRKNPTFWGNSAKSSAYFGTTSMTYWWSLQTLEKVSLI